MAVHFPEITKSLSFVGKMAAHASSLLATLYLPIAFVMVAGLGVATALLLSTINYMTESLVRQSLEASVRSGEREVSQQINLTRLTLKSLVPETQFIQKNGVRSVASFPKNYRAIEERLWQALGVDSAADHFVRYADVNGTFLGLRRIQDGVYEMKKKSRQAVSRSFLPGVQFEQVEVAGDYDARRRPWYQLAAQRKTAIWSPVFLDDLTGTSTLALSQAVYQQDGTLRGIVSTNLSLPALQGALTKLSASKTGWVFILDEQSRLVASSWGQANMANPDRTMPSDATTDSDVPAVREALRSFLNKPAEKKNVGEDAHVIRLEVGDERMWASIHDIADDAGLQWRIGVVVPESELQAPFSQWLSKAVTAAGLSMLLIALIAAWLLYRTLKDFRRLQSAVGATHFGQPMVRLVKESRSALGTLFKSIQSINDRMRTDPLTGAFNREALYLFAKKCIAQSAGSSEVQCALLFIDLDNFKPINDELGHQAGDTALQAVAARLRAGVSDADMVARFGGDEFVICLGNVHSEQEVKQVAEQLKAGISEPIDLGNGIQRSLSASIGVACYPLDGTHFDSLGAVADQRMLEHKRDGKAEQIRYFRQKSREKK